MTLTDLVMWGFIVMMPLSIVANIVTVGKPREPLTPGMAAANVLTAMLLMGALLVTVLK